MRGSNVQLLAYDCRAHGSTVSSDESDLSEEVLVQDSIELIEECLGDKNQHKNNEGRGGKVIIVGHSMGGAIAAKVAATNKVNNLVGAVVIDVVEGTALAALDGMHTILENRPSAFNSIEEAIQWSVATGMLKNIESARLSIPSQLVEDNLHIKWRTDLTETEPYWKGWFTGLSSSFLSSRTSKLLILAGTDRLDKELTIAQMQGKFQLTVLPTCGHTIQEDVSV